MGNILKTLYVYNVGGGSSPRVWGTYIILPVPHAKQRFIPTCVGNILQIKTAFRTPSVHPHVCGEHDLKPLLNGGKRRFIPTCVGNMGYIGMMEFK